jgi:YfiH family protein
MTQWTFGDTFRIFFSDVQDGNMSLKEGYDRQEALRNREALFSFLGGDLENAVFPVQTHSDHITTAGKRERGKGVYFEKDGIEDCDALFSREKNTPLCIQVADCVPIALWDTRKGFSLIIHAGWRGMAKHIVSQSVEYMKKEGSSSEDIGAWIGPSAGPCCFEVGDDVRKRFPRQKNKKNLNLWKEALDQMLSQGVSEEDVVCVTDCTICNSQYFSYRREGKDAGRMVAGIVMMG